MIKIIKKGTRRQATCDTCGCVFSYEFEDICHMETHNGEESLFAGVVPGRKHYVMCPQCLGNCLVSQTRCISEESEE